jgi:methanogenic corrinoid protein MtbC1
MQAHMARGLSAAEAARVVLGETSEVELPEPASAHSPGDLDEERRVLAERLSIYDESAAQASIDRLLATYSLDTVLAEIVIPLLREVGEGWEQGDVTVAQEHFASHVIRSRLMALARGWDQGAGPRAVLACAPGERHDLGLVCHGLALRARGWRITYLGADTPVSTIVEMVDTLSPDAVVLAAQMASRLEPHAPQLAVLADKTTLLIGGRGTDRALAERLGVAYLEGDPVAAADALSARLAT